MILEIQFYTQFKRDIKRAKKRHMDMSLVNYPRLKSRA